MKMNKKGFTLVEILLSIVLTGIVIASAMYYFKIDAVTISMRNSMLGENNIYIKMDTVKKAIHNGFISRYGKNVDNVIANDNSLSFMTTHFSGDASKPDIYTISCPKDGNSNLLAKVNNNKNTVLVKNVKVCQFSYYDISGNETTDSLKVNAVKLKIDYLSNPNNKESVNSLILYEKMMQNT